MPPKSKAAKAVMGRPPKFREARRPITVTLPERTLQSLVAIDEDRARAIVKAVNQTLNRGGESESLVQTVAVAPGSAVIIVPSCRSLRGIPWLRLVEIAPGRFLMAIETGTSVEQFELHLQDLLGTLSGKDSFENRVLSALHRIISASRRQKRVSKAEILFVNTAE